MLARADGEDRDLAANVQMAELRRHQQAEIEKQQNTLNEQRQAIEVSMVGETSLGSAVTMLGSLECCALASSMGQWEASVEVYWTLLFTGADGAAEAARRGEQDPGQSAATTAGEFK